MSGRGKKGGKKSGSHKHGFGTNIGDITLADYANSDAAAGKRRLPKIKTLPDVVRQVKQLNIDDKAWDEMLNDFDRDFDLAKEEIEDDVGVYAMKKGPTCHKKTISESLADKNGGGNTYPLDIWHLISTYIRPEDISTFSAICKSSWSVVNTLTFWLNLYKRYYKAVPNLPARLKPECMVRHHGLKTSVVRALFHMYPPFIARLDRAPMSAPYDLKSRQCISMWQEKYCNKWRLSFKLRRKNCQSNQSNRGEKPKLIDILGDIFANPDDGCTILQVLSSERMMLPVVMGLTLHSINMSLDMTMNHMHVQLVFGSGRICNGKLDTIGTETVSLKTVLQVSVLDWWHPRYPHSNVIIRSDDV